MGTKDKNYMAGRVSEELSLVSLIAGGGQQGVGAGAEGKDTQQMKPASLTTNKCQQSWLLNNWGRESRSLQFIFNDHVFAARTRRMRAHTTAPDL